MKLLMPLILLFSIPTFAQQRKSYFQFYGGVSRSNETTTKGILGLSAGPKLGNAIGLGVGIGFTQFEKPYLPLTADLSLIPTNKKVNPLAGIKAGYGFFNYHPSTTTTVRGGFVGTVYAGISLPGNKLKPNIMIGGTRYTFKSSYQNKSVSSDDKRIFAAVGFLF